MQPHFERYLKCFYREENKDVSVYAKLHKIPTVDILTGNFIAFILQIEKPKKCLEIGCGIGISMDYIMQISTIEKYVALDTNKERLYRCKERHINTKNVEFYNIDGESFLKENEEKYDFIFVDSIKSRYSIMWNYIKRNINHNSLVIFDDVLLYGLLGQEISLIPDKYLHLYEELSDFITELSSDKTYKFFVVPVGNGLLMIKNAN
jgi:predicted O-methyltransferase YrrM